MRSGNHRTGRLGPTPRRTALALALAIATCLPVHEAAAQTPIASQAQVVVFDIPAGDLSVALERFSTQSGIQVVYAADLLKGKRAAAVVGRQTWQAGLEQLLAGSGLAWSRVNSSTVAIKKAPAKPAERAKPKPRAEPAAQEEVTNIPAIMVIGARTLNTDIGRTRDDIQPYVVLDREAIDRSGASSIQELLSRRLPMQTAPHAQGDSENASTRFALRGLGDDETLILVDGRRLAASGSSGRASQSNIAGIPLSAVERIEILPTTASGIYGGSATGGVINVVLKRNYTGVESAFSYENSFGGGGARRTFDVGAGWGLGDGATQLLVAANYSDGSPLYVGDRDLAQAGRAHILNNNPGAIFGISTPPLGATTNIRSLNGAPLTLRDGTSLGSPITFVPEGYAGSDIDGSEALLANAGGYNLELAETAQANGGARQRLSNAPTVKSIMGSVKHKFNDNLEAFLDLSASNSKGKSLANPTTSFTILSTSPNNPFTQDIRVTTPGFGADVPVETSLSDRRATLGFVAKLTKDWQTEIDFGWSRSSRYSKAAPLGLQAGAVAAVMSGQIDVLRDTRKFPVSFQPFLRPPQVYNAADTTMRNISFRLGGSLWSLPGGPAKVAVLLEKRDQDISDQWLVSDVGATLFPERSQNVESMYVELNVPVVSELNSKNGVHELAIMMAGRWDRYKTTSAGIVRTSSISEQLGPIDNVVSRDTSSNPTLGFKYSPIQSLSLRASYGTGFLPPAMAQMVADPTQIVPGAAFSFSGVLDPRRGGEAVGSLVDTITLFSGGNASLKPEESKSRSVGLIFSPATDPKLRLSVDWIRIEKTNGIVSPAAGGLQQVLDLEAVAPDLVTRAKPLPGDTHEVGPITALNLELRNFARTVVEAYDFGLDYKLATNNLGIFELAALATRQVHLQNQIAPGAPVQDNVGLIGGVQWNANATLSWTYQQWRVDWSSRYVDSYWLNSAHAINQSQGSAKVRSQTYHDVFASYWPMSLPSLELKIGIKNILDTAPPVDVTAFPYSSRWGSGPRSYFVSVRKSF